MEKVLQGLVLLPIITIQKNYGTIKQYKKQLELKNIAFSLFTERAPCTDVPENGGCNRQLNEFLGNNNRVYYAFENKIMPEWAVSSRFLRHWLDH